MSLMIPHFTAPSPRHGTGLFTSIALEPGAVLWCFEPAIDRRLPLRPMEPRQRAELLHFGYVNPERPAFVVVCRSPLLWACLIACSLTSAGRRAVVIWLTPWGLRSSWGQLG